MRHPDDYPRSMREEGVRLRRRAMLTEPHVAPLTRFAQQLRDSSSFEVPDFDPLDGGVNARALFLLEKPGPRVSVLSGGSGFISRNNDDPSAEATFGFMDEAGIPRKATVSWNVVPWWNGTIDLTDAELEEGAASLVGLIALLPRLRVVVLVGQSAARHAAPHLRRLPVEVITSAHPSPKVRRMYPGLWRSIPTTWSLVGPYLR